MFSLHVYNSKAQTSWLEEIGYDDGDEGKYCVSAVNIPSVQHGGKFRNSPICVKYTLHCRHLVI